uniref:Ferritin/DPS domain-containing protein n=1 Tax=Ciona savignyi TaxID=51511 RepID=H2ZH70_CIOSA
PETAVFVFLHGYASLCHTETLCLLNLQTFFQEFSVKRRDQAKSLIDYLAKRGANFQTSNIKETNIKDSHKFNATTCLQLSLKMEQEVAFELFNLRAASKLDVDFSKVLNDLISEQTASQFKLQQHLHSLQLMAAHAKDQGLSEFLFDQSL